MSLIHSSLLVRIHSHASLTESELEELVRDPYEESPKYARGIVCFVCATIALFILLRAALALRASRRFSTSVQRGNIYRRLAALARYLSLRQQRILGIRFPALGVGLLLLAFTAFTMLWTWAVRPYYRSRWNVSSPPLAMRTGFMTLGCFPFIFAFATKWNFVTFITGHSHEKLQVYHQFMSHIFLVLSLIHTFPFVIQGMREVKPGFEPLTQLEWTWHVAHKVYYWSGTALLVILAWLCWASLPFIRNRYYETFKYLHVLSALLFLPFFFLHCNKLLGSWSYIWATVAIYGTSVVARFGWMAWINFKGGMPSAEYEIMPCGMVKLRIKMCSVLRWKPGQHFFFHFLSVMPLQSHPFTIASIAHDDRNASQELVVLVRAANGMTRRLLNHLGGHEGKAKEIPLLLDGPYGGMKTDLAIYEHVVLIAGGTGVTFIVPLLQDLVRKMNSSTSDGCVCKSVHVVWSVRDEGAVSWMRAELDHAIQDAPPTSVSVAIHITGTMNDNDDEEDLKYDPNGVALSSLLSERVQVFEVVSAAANQTKTVGVATCGPKSLVFDVRNAVASIEREIMLGRSACREIFLHTEEYSW